MKQQDRKPKTRRLVAPLAASALALLCLGLLSASSASAAYEQVGNFAGTPGVLHEGEIFDLSNPPSPWPEEVQLGGVSGMAVNYTGAGGVPKGTLYAATRFLRESAMRVARYNPDGSFSEAWNLTENTNEEFPPVKERCGPEGDPAQSVCRGNPSAAVRATDVDVDQSTGNVYVYNGETSQAGIGQIHVYSPDGSKLIAEFGEGAASGETTAATPGKLHGTFGALGGIAVNASGDVYLFDYNHSDNYHRLMVFEPQNPGDYEHYVYAGQSHDIQAGFGQETIRPERPVADAAGDIYVAEEEGRLAKLDPAQPTAPPLCQFNFTKGGVISITVNPIGGEVFFSSYKERETIHELSSGCNGEGKFTEASKFSFAPKRTEIGGLAFDPSREFGAGRPAGVLYAGAPSGEGGKTEGKFPERKEESSLGYIFSRPPETPPAVESESFSHVSATTAELGARINPKGSATRYVFQYEAEAAYQANEAGDRFAGASETPPGGAVLGEGTEAVAVSASLAGLAPDTSYRFRVLASSHCSTEDEEKVCEGTGEALVFKTFPEEAPGLSDKRVYELVSPTDKHGGQVVPAEPYLASCDLGCRKPGEFFKHFPMQSAPDGNAIVYEGTAFDAEDSALLENEYLARRDPKTGWQSANLTPIQLYGIGGNNGYKAFDAELTRGVLGQQSPALSPEAPSGYEDLYSQPTSSPLALTALLSAEPPNRTATGTEEFKVNYAGASADLSRIFFAANDALTAETPFAPEALDGGKAKSNLYEWSEGNLALVNVLPGNTETEAGASFGTTSAHGISKDGSRAFFSDESGQVYVRVNGEETKEIATEGVPDPGKFLAASSDGSQVLLQNGHLHSLAGEEPTLDLTQGKGGFQGLVGQGEDLSRIYFVDTEVLTGEEESERGAKAQAGKDNLYAWDEGEGTRFVAKLVAGDNEGLYGGDWSSSPSFRTAEASPDGRYLAFLSQASLTGYDNGEFREAFLYDSATGRLSCVSCNPSGEHPVGFSTLRLIAGGTAAYLPQPRYLTDEGRLYFDSRDSLVPADTNEGIEDVYQYEPKGAGKAGSCTREAGCVSLISAGTGVVDSNFLAMDESGGDVFFTSRDQLVLRDKDELIDLYDAREEGGIPAETEVARSECQGEACQASVSAPNDPTPGSSTFEGAGNVKEEGKAKKHKKKRHAKKHSHKRAAKHNRGGVK
jgi:hypothetical protein